MLIALLKPEEELQSPPIVGSIGDNKKCNKTQQ
jgi:hypothetical protein